jgi:hypothetical protein
MAGRKPLPIPLQRFFCAARPICQNRFKKETEEEKREKPEKSTKERGKKEERRNKYEGMKGRERERKMDGWMDE